MAEAERKILVTGAFGQIGSELVPALQQKHGIDHVVTLGHSNVPQDFKGIVETGDTSNKEGLEAIVDRHNIGVVYHLVSLLSARGEENPDLTWDINMGGLKNVLDIARDRNLKVFWPSSIAVFGPTTPRDSTPQHTILEPTTMYGATKVAGENLVRHYVLKQGVDVRSLRYPGLISWKAEPGGGTTDYAVAIFYDGLRKKEYQCFVSSDTTLPMMYMDDAIRGTIELMEADLDFQNEGKWNSYNMAAISFAAVQLAEELKKHIPDLKVTYKPDHRQAIADSWPKSIDDSVARAEWGWSHEFDLSKMTAIMVEKLREKFGQTK
ncbi:MAG: NAD-dependent epimerase/dehydratase family protein [Candidatus Levybacteria bacterium]|nr:NAD-dependent epimerase/dehydratase family protein [Candidatus Levybacteria bacterium]